MFSEVFLKLSFSFLPEGFPLSSLLRKVGKTRTGGSSKAHRVSFSMSTIVCLFSENGCKGKNFISYLPNVFRTFFSGRLRYCLEDFHSITSINVKLSSSKEHRNQPVHCQNVKRSPLSFSKAGAKVGLLYIHTKN